MSTCSLSQSMGGGFRVALSLVALGFGGLALAQADPPGFVVSPEIYKVIAENAKYRVIEVTWTPGQKDKPHSHPDAAVYFLTNCHTRGQFGNNPPQEGKPQAGTARIQAPIASHTVENIGTTDCKLIMFEPK